VNARVRRVATLAAAMVAGRAERLVAMLSGTGAEGAVEFTLALAARPRAERLAALQDAFAVAAAPPAPMLASPVLRRLARELAAASVGRVPPGALHRDSRLLRARASECGVGGSAGRGAGSAHPGPGVHPQDG
jgi:hypothetical protein